MICHSILFVIFIIIMMGCSHYFSSADEREDSVQSISEVEKNSIHNVAETKRPQSYTDYTTILSDGVKIEMIWINPGAFMMGSCSQELDRADNETQHIVMISDGFWLGKYEVTQAQYKAVMGYNPASNFGVGDNYPVYNVTWYDAKEFCEELTKIERKIGRLPAGYEYTMPTEVQWEYACRAGVTTAFNNGTDITNKDKCPNMDKVGWYAYNDNYEARPVGLKEPNTWGLYDMHGNVWEWCLDRNPDPAIVGVNAFIRGGSWASDAGSCRSAMRGFYNPADSLEIAGFRLALVPVQ